MVCGSLLQSSRKSKALNLSFFLFTLMSWIGCCVAFGGVLATASLGNSDVSFYWDKLHVSGVGDTTYDSNYGNCSSGGKGFLAMMVFAFLGLLSVLVLDVLRLSGVHISALEPTRKVLFFQMVFTFSNTFFYFLSVCIFGGTIFKWANDQSTISSVKGTGYGYIIFCFFEMLASCVLIYLIRADSSCHLGSSGAPDAQQSNDTAQPYNPPASYQYNANPQVYGGYSGDVQPNQGESNI